MNCRILYLPILVCAVNLHTILQPMHGTRFENEINAARHAEGSYEDKIGRYQSAVALLSKSGIDTQDVQMLIDDLAGLVSIRPKQNSSKLCTLNALLKSVSELSHPQIQAMARDIDRWSAAVNRDLQQFALKNGDMVRLVMGDGANRRREYVLVDYDGRAAQIKFSQGAHVELPAVFVLKLVDNNGLQGQSLASGGKFELVPVYMQHQDIAYLCPRNYRLSLAGASQASLAYPVVVDSSRNAQLVVNKLTDDQSIDVQAQSVAQVQPVVSGENVKLSSSTNAIHCSLERISSADLMVVKDKNVATLFAQVDKSSAANEKLAWLEHVIGQLEFGTSPENKMKLTKSVNELVDARLMLNVDDARKLRTLVVQVNEKPYMSRYQNHVDSWLAQLDNLMMQRHVISYGDVICVASAAPEKRVVWAHDQTRPGINDAGSILVGPNTDVRTKNGMHMMRVLSPLASRGPLRYGDEVEFIALCGRDNDPESRQGGFPLKWWVNSDSRFGKTYHELLLGSESRFKDPRASVFEIKPPAGLESLRDRHAVVAVGDAVQLVSKPEGRILWLHYSSPFGKPWAEIFAGPNDDESRVASGHQLFTFDRLSRENVVASVSENFGKRLAALSGKKTFEERLNGVYDLVGLLSPSLNKEKRRAFWDTLLCLIAEKEDTSPANVGRLVDLVREVKTMAENQGLKWSKRCAKLERDLQFSHHMRVAAHTGGVEQVQQLAGLIPHLKTVSQNQSSQFLHSIKNLREEKKKEAQAAKLLLTQANQAMGLGVTVTGTGNLLVP